MNCLYCFLIGSFEDMGILHVFIYLSVMGRYNPLSIKTKLKYVKNAHIFKATTQKKSTQCILLFLFLLFTQKNRRGEPDPPPQQTRSL